MAQRAATDGAEPEAENDDEDEGHEGQDAGQGEVLRAATTGRAKARSGAGDAITRPDPWGPFDAADFGCSLPRVGAIGFDGSSKSGAACRGRSHLVKQLHRGSQ